MQKFFFVNNRRLSVQVGAERAKDVYVFRLSFRSACRRWWLGSLPPSLPLLFSFPLPPSPLKLSAIPARPFSLRLLSLKKENGETETFFFLVLSLSLSLSLCCFLALVQEALLEFLVSPASGSTN